MAFYTYIVASQRNGTLYIGSTENMANRAEEHRAKTREGFTAKYGVSILVWYEAYDTRDAAFPSGMKDEEVEPGVEDRAHRAVQSWLAGFERRVELKNLGPRLRGDERSGLHG